MSKPLFNLKLMYDKVGLTMFFKPWQLDCLRELWSTSEGLSSRQVYEAVEDQVSRASVINFLEGLSVYGFLDRSEITGKGGHRGIYATKYDENGTKKYLRKIFSEKLDQI